MPRLAAVAWAPHCISKTLQIPQLSIWNTSDLLRLLWVHLPIQTDYHFNFLPWDVSGCDGSISTNDLLRIFALPSRRTHCCHWVTSMMQQMTQRTHPSVSFCRALHLLNNRFSNTLQLYPSFIPYDFILGWPPLSSNVAINNLCTCCPIALENPQGCGSSMLETSIKSSKH